jgi:hypothetical protein
MLIQSSPHRHLGEVGDLSSTLANVLNHLLDAMQTYVGL